MSKNYSVQLFYAFEKNGVLKNKEDEKSVVSKINLKIFNEMKKAKSVSDGMLPKLENAFFALKHGVKNVFIGHYKHIFEVIQNKKGTRISNS